MGFSSGVFSRPVSDYVFDTVISETDMNTEMAGIATGLSSCMLKDGTQTLTANIPFSGYKITGYGSTSTPNARTDVPSIGQVQDLSFTYCGTAGGTQNALTFTPTPAITAYAAGQCFVGVIGASSTNSTVTLAVSGLTAKAVQIDGSALSSSVVLTTGKIYRFDYDGTQFQATRLSLVPFSDPMTTRGDIIVRNSSNVSARLAVGAAGTALLSDGTDPAWAGVHKQGLQTIWVPASAMVSRTTNGAAAGTAESSTNKVMTKSLDFDTSTQEFAQFAVRFPKNWNEGTVTFAPIWTAASGSGGVVFGLAGIALSDDDALDTAYGTAQTSTDTLITANDVHVGPTSSAITIDGTPAAGDWVSFQINRTVADGSDTLGVDARLLGVAMFFTTNAADDS